MKNYDIKKIRNLTFIGACGSGKTSLIEQILFNAKMTTRVGKIDDGNTVMDFDAEEIARKMSISMSIAYADWRNHRINIVDTPGYSDFTGEQVLGVQAADTVAVITNATNGYEVGLEKSLEIIENVNRSVAVFVNRMDNDGADFEKVLEVISDNSKFKPIPVLYPIGSEEKFKGVVDLISNKAYIDDKPAEIPSDIKDLIEEKRTALMEAIAETDENLLNKFLEEMELNEQDMRNGLINGVNSGDIVPAFSFSATKNVAVISLMDAINAYLPSPLDKKEVTVIENEKEKMLSVSEDGDLLAYIFKSFSDPNFGDVSYVRLFSGTLKSGSEVFVPEENLKDKIGNMYYIIGKNRKDVSEVRAGEIVGLVKLKVAHSLNSLVSVNGKYLYPKVELPSAVVWKAIKAVKQSDDDKIGSALQKVLDEEPTLHIDRNKETHEVVLSGMGGQQINFVQKKLLSRYKVDTELSIPRVPYRETIQGKTEVEYKHKKQSGGRGQFGHVLFRISPKPRGDGFEFINSIVGGVIPSKFIPAIEKGLQETMDKGIIAGSKVVDICVDCYYGSYHDVDSSEMAFKIASSQALKNGFVNCKPILLEPVHKLQIIIPLEYMGDVMGDISTRRGKITGMEQKGKKQILNAEIPLVELFEYFPNLKSLTQGRGRFNQEFSHYEKVPSELAEKIIADYKESQEN